MNKKRLGFLVLICILVVTLVGCSNGGKEKTNNEAPASDKQQAIKDSYVFGSGSMGSFYYTAMEAMTSVLNQKQSDFKTSAMSTNGGAENISLLFGNKIDFGAISGTEFVLAYNGEKPFKEKLEPAQVLTFGLGQQLIAVRDDSGINTINDLEGKKVAIGPNGSSAASMMKTIFALAGVKIEPVYLSHEEGKDAFISGMVDGALMLFMNYEPYPTTMQAEAAVANMKYLEWDKELTQKLVNEGLGFVESTMPKEKSKFLPRDYNVYCSTLVLGTRVDTPEDVVYNIVKTLAQNTGELAKINGQLASVKDDTIDSAFIDTFYVHKGTAKYLKEIGKWNDKFKIAE